MKWKKPPDGLIERFGAALPDDPGIERRLLFGYPAAFFQGHMFCGLYEDRFIVRLPDAERASFLKQPGAKVFEPMAGRPMKEYVLVPPAVVERDALLSGWLRQSLEYVSGLPPKAARAPKAARSAKAPRAARPAKPRRPAKARAKPAAARRSRPTATARKGRPPPKRPARPARPSAKKKRR
jgi:TfoX/Sxy family transcriptional regulator of competence genes